MLYEVITGIRDPLHPIGGEFDALPIHPGLDPGVVQCIIQFLNEHLVPAGIGDENASLRSLFRFGHERYSLALATHKPRGDIV